MPTTPALRRLRSLAIVILASLAYQSSVDDAFQVVRAPLLTAESRPEHGLVRLDLPRVPVPHGTPLILRGRIRNDGPQDERVRLLLDRFPLRTFTVRPSTSRDFNVTLSEGAERAMRDRLDAPHAIELRATGNDWRLVALEAANAYFEAAGPLDAALVPARVKPGPRLPAAAAWGLVALLELLAVRYGRRPRGAALSALCRAAGLLVLLGFGAAVALPLLSSYRVLLQPPVFWCAVLVLRGPGLAARIRPADLFRGAVRRGSSALKAVGRATTGWWANHRLTLERACTLIGLVALAIAQPLFDVMRGSPEFFVARNTSWTDAIGAVLLVCGGLPLALLAVERLVRVVSPRLAAAFFSTLVCGLAASMVLPWLTRNAVAAPAARVSIALAAGALVAAGASKVSAVRQGLVVLSAAGVIAPAVFFADSDMRGALTPPTARMTTPPVARTPPIVVVVFDEFPLSSLVDAEGQIDAARYPNFAQFARDGSWFREANTVSTETVWAVPAIVTGRYPATPGAVPTLRYYPENLFTLLADRYEMFVFGRFLQLCPGERCHFDLGGPGEGPVALVADLSVVWLHIVTPEPWAEGLPPVIGDWRGFARDRRWRTSDGERVRNDRRSEFERFVATIDERPGRLYFLHTLMPHMPFEFVPSGHRYAAPDYQGRKEGGEGLFRRASPEYVDALLQRHLLQVGFVDTMVGLLLQRLRDLGTYDDTLVVVTADHGASYREGMPRRAAINDNIADILRVPMFVKWPGQPAGGPSDRRVESVDILPTIAAVLGMRLPFAVDGRSLLDPDEAPRPDWTFIDRSLTRVTRRRVTDMRSSSEATLARRLARFGSGPVRALYATPGTVDLLGRRVDTLPQRGGDVRVVLANGAGFAAVDLAQQTLPLYVRGRVEGVLRQPLAIAVNGRIAATAIPYTERGATVFGTLIPADVLREGPNEVTVFVVEGEGGATTLVATIAG